jgi:hypothetical protein
MAGAVAMLLAANLASPPLAAAGKWKFRQARKASCPPSKTLVDTDTKTCPATPLRPAIVLTRACCENRKGKVMCKHFSRCPKRSPS